MYGAAPTLREIERLLAVEISRRRLCRRRAGMPATVRDVSARACAYSELFERSAATVRLRGVGYLGDPGD